MTRNVEVSRLLDEFSLTAQFPPEVCREAQRWADAPEIDDPSLEDLTALPFVTIDNADSRDLDQALYIDTDDADAPTVHYALADASHYVGRGTALFAEALRRGASVYLPGFVVPMLPRVLSEGIVSLLPGVDRRALVFSITLDAQGEVSQTVLRRARVRSRAKLTYDGVQAWFDAAGGHRFDSAEFAVSLRALATVGQLRMRRAEARGIVQFRRVGVVVVEADGGWEAHPDERNDVERYNEQISLLCNTQGARFLDGADPNVQAVYKVHPEPEPRQLTALAGAIGQIARDQGLGAAFVWEPERQTLADFIRALPVGGEHDRVRQAIERQAMIMGSASRFSLERGCHYGVGADAYGRFTAPMRELVGVFTHREAIEKLTGHGNDDAMIAEQVIEAGNRSKRLQRQVTKAVYKVVLDRVFAAEAGPQAPVRTGTVLGIEKGRLFVSLDDPPLEVKIYASDVPQGQIWRPGDTIRIRAQNANGQRWRLVPVD